MKLWGGRFTKATDKSVEEFNASIQFDCRMYAEDICGSIAHATMLSRQGILSAADANAIVEGLKKIYGQIEQGEFEFSVELEDIHMNVEKRLTDAIGEAGKRLHTGRSRNDQVALDTHLYIRREIAAVARLLMQLQQAMITAAKRYSDVIMPGYTHLQRAQPILFSHHMMAYFSMLSRDFIHLQYAWDMADRMPLGAGALAGTTYPLDQPFVAELLHFGKIYDNSLDAVSDRDYIIAFLEFAAVLMMHLSRLSEEFILWSSSEFKFIELDDSHCTGSSIMPQKKNPDICELVRGKTGRFYGHLMGVLTMMKGIPMAYDKDMQEDKEGVFDAIDNLKFALTIYAAMINKMTVNGQRMRDVLECDFSNATDMADYLAKKGLPFREAHAVVGKAVHYCIEQGKVLQQLTLDELQGMSPLFSEDIHHYLNIETCVRQRNTYNGTSPASVQRQCHAGTAAVVEEEKQITKWDTAVSAVYEVLK
ncbi:argininosuccinate lyase [Megasphaera cerevisiae DSM 20462]|jgi:argininosuccinate lyase|uniref:Argininosuccinate lyase n=1 Tax=Megasphaera cerevisiae DSM 20462 TaxID=1122219 RepID=A0A0J6WWQ6_9FIRM|nr:argininosuccinate lyase [Megasphaera cerevisiae]KMO87009.1 argininosuccinate lyase [Megasphaera cerevisiae DSM 20462]MCI1750546.1 argininosuccinate lyase [Megasphaera cerevisiae]OKY54042.1 argininosuccinate lyase [Megasphaera cerevisiae]SJZ82214.1 argininosuccinate lyase [Megasphaera cerevisiae DSM 20462]